MSKTRQNGKRLVAFAVVVVAAFGVAALALDDRTALAVALLGLLAGGLGLILVQGLSRLHQHVTRLAEQSARTAKDVLAATAAAEDSMRRVLTTADKQQVAGESRHKQTAAVLGALRRQINHDATNLLRAQHREIEGLHQLYNAFAPRAPMPSSGQWALDPTGLLGVLHLIERHRPRLVVELGSGTSTVWIAYALERLGGRIVSLDHDPQYADKTRAMLEAHGLTAVAEVRDAPLRPISVRGDDYSWYSVDAVSDLDGIDLLLVDGPPAAIGPMARFPALDALRDRFAATAMVVLDDVSRDDEQETMRRWAQEQGAVAEPTLIGQHGLLVFGRPTAPGQRPGSSASAVAAG